MARNNSTTTRRVTTTASQTQKDPAASATSTDEAVKDIVETPENDTVTAEESKPTDETTAQSSNDVPKEASGNLTTDQVVEEGYTGILLVIDERMAEHVKKMARNSPSDEKTKIAAQRVFFTTLVEGALIIRDEVFNDYMQLMTGYFKKYSGPDQALSDERVMMYINQMPIQNAHKTLAAFLVRLFSLLAETESSQEAGKNYSTTAISKILGKKLERLEEYLGKN